MSDVGEGGPGRLLSVNVGRPRLLAAPGGRTEPSAIAKEPVGGRVAVRGVNLDGDDQADRSVHGGPDKAVYSYASEDYTWWASELDRPLEPGTFGENLTTQGVDVSGAVIGEHWLVGSTRLQVAQPRQPCWKLTATMNEPRFQQRFNRAARFGAYLRILEEGDLGVGDAVEVLERPAHGVTVRDVGVIATAERHRVAELLDVPELGPSWHDWVRAQL